MWNTILTVIGWLISLIPSILHKQVPKDKDKDSEPIEVSTPWIGGESNKLFLQSGQFSSTLKTSQYVGGIDNHPSGYVSFMGTKLPVRNELEN